VVKIIGQAEPQTGIGVIHATGMMWRSRRMPR
jgi:hypothetical protein